MKKYLFLTLLLLSGCNTPRYIEKYSEPLKQAAYANNDSLVQARVDLAWHYSNELTKIIPPPKNRIVIKPLYAPKTVTSGNTKTVSVPKGKRLLIVPDEYKNDKVVVVDSAEYNALKQDREVKKQLASEIEALKKQDNIIADQKNLDDKTMKKFLEDYDKRGTQIAEKDAAIWHRNFIILGLTTLIAGFIVIKLGLFGSRFAIPFL